LHGDPEVEAVFQSLTKFVVGKGNKIFSGVTNGFMDGVLRRLLRSWLWL
jgi:hypothetical protein